MAESAHSTNPSRRLFLAAGSAATVFGSLSAAAESRSEVLDPQAESADCTREKGDWNHGSASLTDIERQILLENYHTWLFSELRYLEDELGIPGFVAINNEAWFFHWRAYGEEPAPQPSERAQAVLAAIECDWRKDLPKTGGANV